MATTHHFKIKELLSEDAAGVVYRAYDHASGSKVFLRKYVHYPHSGEGLHAVEEVAYQVSIDRLSGVRHPSLRRIVSGGCDPQDGTPYVATRTIDAEPLQNVLKQSCLSVELTTSLLWQLLELSELLSHVLAEEGVWVETDPASIAVIADHQETRFIFWASPLKCLNGGSKPGDLDAIVKLTEAVTGWQGHEIDEREGGHLHPWLGWLKETTAQSTTTIREAREMLAAAAGVEPPPPIDSLLVEAQRRRSLLEKWPSVSFKWIRAPKMPLFALLCLMFIVQSTLGWLWIRHINRSIDKDLEDVTLSIYDYHYTAPESDDNGDEPGSRPLNLDPE